MNREGAKDFLIDISYKLGNMSIEYLTEKDGEKMREAIKALEQESCEDEYIKVPKKALKYRTAGMVAYNAEWLKNHFDIERAVICGAQEPCEDAISRQAVEDKLLKLCNELEGIFANIRMKEVDDCVCGLCEYDCDHGIDGSAFECPGFETDECFKLAAEIRHEWQSIHDLPPVNPQPREMM